MTIETPDLSDLRGHPPPADEAQAPLAQIQINKQKYTERELLKCIIEDPKYLAKTLGFSQGEDTGLQNIQQKKEMLKYLYRSYSGLTKYLLRQISQNRAIDFPLVGRFYPQENSKNVVFVPHLDFVDSGRYKFAQNECNISPLAKNVPRAVAQKISIGAIGLTCEYDREIVASILKDIMVQFIKVSRMGREVILDLKIGYLHAYPNGDLQFEHQLLNDSSTGRLMARHLKNSERVVNEQNLEKLARAMSMGASSVNVKSCYQSVKTPATLKSSKSQASKLSGLTKGYNTITNNWYGRKKFDANSRTSSEQTFSKNNNKMPDIYSNFSKQTHSTYQIIQKRTEARVTKKQEKQKSDVISNLSKNEYIPHETLEQFILKQLVERPGKKIYFSKQPNLDDRKKLLKDYLMEIDSKEKEKQIGKEKEVKGEQDEIYKIQEDIKANEEMTFIKKKGKQAEMVKNIEEVKAERQTQDIKERKHIFDKPESVYFPFTHGDSVDAARIQIREELNQDLKNRQALLESQQREQMGTEKYDEVYGLNSEQDRPEIDNERKMYPQGGNKQVQLRDQFQKSTPFYLKQNAPNMKRKTDSGVQNSAIEAARSRFEEKLKQEKQQNTKQIDDYQNYMDEAIKFQELKKIKDEQNKQLTKTLLEQQIQEDNDRKLNSQQYRRSRLGGELTFGPKETEETLIYQQLKKEQEKQITQQNLVSQIANNTKGGLLNRNREIYMEKHNVNSAQREIVAQAIKKSDNYQKDMAEVKEEWSKQKEGRKEQVKVDNEVEKVLEQLREEEDN